MAKTIKKAPKVLKSASPSSPASRSRKDSGSKARPGGSGPSTRIVAKPAKKPLRKPLLTSKEETQVHLVDRHEIKFSNLSKVYWPDEGYTKRDLLNYYYQVAEYIVPYLLDRPQSLNRFPNGIYGESFYHKDMTASAPDWIAFFPYHTSDGKDKNYMICKGEADLLYMANLGAIEMNPWNSKAQSEDNPDWCIIDIDPTERNPFEQVIQTAQVTRQVLEELGVTSYVKTSGSTGIHIYMPLAAKYSYETCQLFARWVAGEVHHRLPRFTSVERLTNKRRGKIYVDFLQNRPKATLAAPYAVRPKPGATVSMPLHWDEVKKGLSMKDFTIKNAVSRVRRNGDIFRPVLGKGIDVEEIIRKVK